MGDNDPTLTQAAEPETTPERAGKYRIAGRIGQGGMGIVYRGTDEDLGRTVALKFLPPELAGNSEAAHRFLREARAASALDHPNIGTIFGVEETADHRRFIVMAFYEGRNLHERMKDTLHPIGPAEALSIAVQVARGLAAAHANEVVHRDIKPSNILITSQGVVKIVDFGLAAMVDAEQLTVAGTSMGTPAYMSPEQALGKPVDRRSDIWSLGVVLLEMLTHERVFRAEAMQGVLYQVVHGEIAGLGRLQQPLRGVVARALDRDPEKRWQSANDFLEALEGLSGTLPELKAARVPRRIFRLAGVLPVVAIFLAVLLGGGVYYGKFRGPGKVAVAPRSSSIFDKYRQAVDLMTRWDKEGNLERAAALLAENVKADPTFALGFARLAETQRLRYALTRDQKALDEASRNAEEALRLNPELAPVQVVWGRVQALRGNNDLAMASFERAVRTDPNDADAQLAIARQYERLGRLADSEAAFRKAGVLEPDGIASHDFYANFLYRQGRFGDAIREWQTALRLAPDHLPDLVNLGAALVETGELDEGIAVYKKVIELKPTAMAFNNLGVVYDRLERNTEAVEAFHRAIEMTPDSYLFEGNLAVAYWKIGGLGDQAQQTFTRAIELGEKVRRENPRDAEVQKYLAGYYARTNNQSLALQRIETALTLSPNSPDIQATGAQVYELLGQRKKALVLAKRAMELGFPRKRLEQESPELAHLLPESR